MIQDDFGSIPKDEQRLAKRLQKEAVTAKPAKWLTNEQFHALDPASKRVAIAQDVIKWLNMRKLSPQTGSYLQLLSLPALPADFDVDWAADFGATKLDEGSHPTVNGYSCSVCALGGVFAVAAERGCTRLGAAVTGAGMHRELAPYFTNAQLSLIEAAFERSTSFNYSSCDGPDASAAEKIEAFAFGRAVEDSVVAPVGTSYNAERRLAHGRIMRAIMQNIIDNGGDFIP